MAIQHSTKLMLVCKISFMQFASQIQLLGSYILIKLFLKKKIHQNWRLCFKSSGGFKLTCISSTTFFFRISRYVKKSCGGNSKRKLEERLEVIFSKIFGWRAMKKKNPGKEEDGRHVEWNIISITRKRVYGGLKSTANSDWYETAQCACHSSILRLRMRSYQHERLSSKTHYSNYYFRTFSLFSQLQEHCI